VSNLIYWIFGLIRQNPTYWIVFFRFKTQIALLRKIYKRRRRRSTWSNSEKGKLGRHNMKERPVRFGQNNAKGAKNMAKAKCANCGAQLIEAYTREGLAINICPHTKATPTKSISGVYRQLDVYCRLDIKGLRATFETLTKKAISIEQLRKATRETVSNAKLYEQANLAIMLDLPVDELPELFESAFNLSLSIGLQPMKGIEALCKGVGRRSRLILDNIGIVFKAQEAYNWYKNEYNKEKLSESERTEAWQKYAIKLIKEKASKIT